MNEKLTLEFWQTRIKSDEYWCQCMAMVHRGKSLDDAIELSFAYLLADPIRLGAMDDSDFKRFTSGWMSKMRATENRKEAELSHSDWLKKNVRR